jgi:peptidoglycan/xylan/chitin deacetylase (PgdA/CDA1 family)
MFRQGVREYKARIAHIAGILLTLILLFSLPISPATSATRGGDPVAFLTFDCEGRGVPQVLAALEAEHVNATMFLVGSWALAHPALVRRMVADGDALGNHSYSHPLFTTLSTAAVRSQIEQAQAAILRASGGVSPRPRFRFPYGAGQGNPRLMSIVAAKGYHAYYWTVDPQDWRGFSSATIAQRVLNQTRAGGIVVLHPASPGTPGAVPASINGLRARGYRFATLS